MYNKIKKFLSGKKNLESNRELVSGSRYLHSEHSDTKLKTLQKIAENAVLFMGELPREINENVKKSERGKFARDFITAMNDELVAIAPLLKKMDREYFKQIDNPKKYNMLTYELELNKLSELVGQPVSLYLDTDFMGANGISGLLRVGDDDFRIKLARTKYTNVYEAFNSLQMNRAKQPGVKKTYLSVSANGGPNWILSENLTDERAAAYKKYIPKLFGDNDTAVGNTINDVYFDTGCFSRTKYNKMNWRERKEYRATVEKIIQNGMSPGLAKKLQDYDELIKRIMDSYAASGNDAVYANYERAIRENPLKVTENEVLEISVLCGLKYYRDGIHRNDPATPANIFDDVDFARRKFVLNNNLEK